MQFFMLKEIYRRPKMHVRKWDWEEGIGKGEMAREITGWRGEGGVL